MTELAIAWLIWVAFNLTVMLTAPSFAQPFFGAYTNGVQVVVPTWVRDSLTQDELKAVIAHELGHIARRHAWWNVGLACLFLFVCMSEERRRTQEFEADDYAASLGYGLALASALRKLSTYHFDRQRAERLEVGEKAVPLAPYREQGLR